MGTLLVKMDELNLISGETEQKEAKKVEKESKYQRLRERFHELGRLYREKRDIEYLMEDDSLCHIMECGRLALYETIAKVAKEKGATRVFDIGCAYGHQSEIFLNEKMTYIGVTDHQSDFWNRDTFDYIVGRYPCELPVQKGDIGVSVLCLTWNCYLYNGEDTLRNQCEALQRDFEHCLIYAQDDNVNFLKGYFKEVTHIEDNLYYFSNK